MPKKNIEIGRTPNDGTGDNLKIVIAKVNENIDDIYIEKQDTLVSGTNIKTINSTSILGSGNIALQSNLVSGTNIKTINGNSVLGSGDLVISGGSSGASGIHAFTKLTSGRSITAMVNSTAPGVTAGVANRLYVYPFIPNQTLTCSSMYININALFSGALAKIVIYSDTNGIPNNLLYSSADINCSTTGIKTISTNQTFTAGTIYWIGLHSSSTPTFTSISTTALMPLSILATNVQSSIFNTNTYGTPPNPFSIGYTITNAPVPLVGITI